MTTIRNATVLLGAILMGILAGFFLTYGFTIMPALATVDDRTFVGAFQGLERMFGNPEYGFNWPVFLGYLVGPIVVALALVLNRKRPVRSWIAAALVLALLTALSTEIFNVPLNEALIAAGDPDTIDVAQVRVDFREDWWRLWNHVRSATSLGAFLCLTWGLYRYGPSRSDSTTLDLTTGDTPTGDAASADPTGSAPVALD